jgi:predicted O-methyltransferase YrrM
MRSIGQGLSVEIARAYNPQRFTKMLDVGGASGTYTIAFLREDPHLKATLFDLEPVIPLARKRVESEGLTDRVSFVDGDFYKDDLPGGHDLVLLSAIIHQNSANENKDLYRKALHALVPGGTVLIRDHIMNDARTKPPAGAMFALNMLVNTSGGDTYTLGEVKDGLEETGFVNVRLVRTGERMDCLAEAQKPA